MREPTSPPQTQAPTTIPGAPDAMPSAPALLPQRAVLLVGNRVRAKQVLDELQRHGIEVHLLWSMDRVAAVLASVQPDVVIADAPSFPDSQEAARAVQTVRAALPDVEVPVLLLAEAAGLATWDLLLAADDFVLEPLRAPELAARAALLARRASQPNRKGTLVAGRLVMDLIGHKVLVNGQEVYLTHREFELIRFLVMNRGRVVTREMVRQHLWGPDADEGLRTIDVHIRRIRSKLERSGGRFIETVRNVGYKFVE
ncbi:MAG: winged-helix domain-containing protein [Chloroflexi bacterium]|nr:winged-helix domain-containing protein [Chloroflexota bacterium]